MEGRSLATDGFVVDDQDLQADLLIQNLPDDDDCFYYHLTVV